MKKIVILALHLGYGGVEKYIYSLAEMLKDDYNIEIISTYKLADKPAFDFDKKIKIHYLINEGPDKEGLKKLIKSKKLIKAFIKGLHLVIMLIKKYTLNIKSIKKIDADYIITTRYFHSKLVAKYAKKDIIKIATEHNYHNNDKKYINNVVNSTKDFDYFVLVSEELKDFYQDKFDKTKCIYIPNVIDFKAKIKSTLKDNVVLSIGRLEVEKNQLDLIPIIKNVKKQIPDIKLYIIGDGSKKDEIQKAIELNDLQNNVFLTGFLTPKEIEKYYKSAKLFLMTSLTESFGLVLIESMNYGVPCVAYSCASGARALLKNDIGILIENQDIDAYSIEMIRLLKNEKKLKEMQDTSVEYSKEFLAKNVSKKWLKLLNGGKND